MERGRAVTIGIRFLVVLLVAVFGYFTSVFWLVVVLGIATRGTVTTGEEALKLCEVRPLESVMPGSTLVSAICSKSSGIGMGARLYLHVKAGLNVKLTGGHALPYPKPGTQAAQDQRVGTCGLLVDDSEEERQSLREFLHEQGMQAPPPDAAYATWETDVPIMAFGGGAPSIVELLRVREDVWITVAICGLS